VAAQEHQRLSLAHAQVLHRHRRDRARARRRVRRRCARSSSARSSSIQYDNGENLKAVGGLYYLNEDLPSEQAAFADSFLAFNGIPLPFTRTVRDDLSTDSWAAFLHAEWMFAPTWTLAAGLRYTSEDKDYFRTTTTYSTLARCAARSRSSRRLLERDDAVDRLAEAVHGQHHGLRLGQPRLQVRRLQRPANSRDRGQLVRSPSTCGPTRPA
jgi:hypothetical protein